jgi:hypothetical protein
LPRNSPQVGVEKSHQTAQRFFIAVIPGGEQPADILRTLLSHCGRNRTTKQFMFGDPFSRPFPEYWQEAIQT